MSAETWALLWSKKQNCFHIEPATELFKKNVRAMHENRALNDYHPIHVGTRDACEKVADLNRYLLKERDALRA
jgi:hypothetical protein